MGVLPLVLLLAGGAALLSLVATLALRRLRRADLASRARRAMAARKASRRPATPPAPAPAPDGPSAIGFASGRDATELELDAAAIEHACSERGWKLASMVREDASVASNGHATPALALALDRLASGEASRLVTGRLDHLARSRANLGGVLDWCTRHGVELVAVDVGLDTSTRDGRLAARCLLAAGPGNGNGAGDDTGHTASVDPEPRPRPRWTGPLAIARRRFLR
jgi:hypothetical protein